MPYAPRTHRALPKSFARPRDERVSSAKRGYDRAWRERRLRILERDHYLCQLCGTPTGKSGHVDHIVSKRKGGTDDDSNLQTTCHRCHSRKTVREDGGKPR